MKGFLRYFISIISVSLCSVYSFETFGQASVVSGSVTTSKTNYSPGIGNNRLLVVSVSNETNNNARTVTSITWGGQALTFAVSRNNGGSGSNDLRAEIWYLNEAGINAAAANCNNFTVNWSGAVTTETFAVYTLKDVDQATPVATTGSAAPAANSTTVTLSSVAVGINDIVCYASATQANSTHSPATGYTEHSDQVVGSTTALSTASKQISVAGNETPIATWSVSDQILIAGVVINGVAATGSVTYYSRNATTGGSWNSNTSWTTNSDGSGGPLAAGTWPRRQDNVVVLSGHTITIDATDDNKSCGVSPDGLARSNIGAGGGVGFNGSNLAMFYQTGDITIHGTVSVIGGINMMVEGYTQITPTGTFSLTSYLVNVGYLEADASSTLTTLDDLSLTGNSITIINTNSTTADDLNIDFTNATLCGTGTSTLLNSGGSAINYTNSASVNQICTTFTVNCSGGGCSGFPVVGTGSFASGNTGPGGVGNSSTNQLWVMADQGVFINAGTTAATDNQLVQQWNDFSGNSRHATELTNKPTLRTSIVNGLPVIRYDNIDRLLSTGLTTANSASVYVVAQYSSLPPNNPGLVQGSPTGLGFSATGTDKVLGMWVNSAGTSWGRVVQTDNTPINIPQVTSLPLSTFFALSNIVSATSLTVSQYVDNVVSGSIAYNGTMRSWTDFGIGRQGGETWNGDIAEVVVYNADLNTAQRAIVSNYLSAKYATPLSVANDLYTMDSGGNGNFDFQVAGVGQASDGSNHKDAKGPGQVRMVVQSPSSLENGEYLLWGHNNGSFASSLLDVDGTLIKERVARIWRVSETGDVGNVAISFDMTSLNGSPLQTNLRLLIDRDGDGFADNDVTPLGGGTLSGEIITFTGVNLQNGDRFTLGNTDLSNPLPIELVSFSAEAQQADVKLQWTTASELNNDFFTIQRSQDAENWEDIIDVKGAGNSNERIEYEIIDGLPYSGVSYYRLKQTDFDKKYSYSGVRRVDVTQAYQLKVYPNPSSGNFRISTGFEIQPGDVKFTNMLGQPIPITMEADGYSMIVNSGSLSTGIYILQVNRGYWKQTVRVVAE